MRIIITENYEQMSERAAEIVARVVTDKPDAVLGLATGTTPLGLYERLIADRAANGTDYGRVRTVNLDEYMGLPKTHEQSYAHFMRKNLFDAIGIKPENTNIENGEASDEKAECERYDRVLEELPRDFQLLGLGSNGHIAFNEPNTPFGSTTHVVTLADSTVKDNSRLFADIADVPRKAFTMGLKSIMHAKKILVLASGANKADAVYGMTRGEIKESLPASVLQLHPDCTLIIDKAAAARL
ncbi:MAG: glucosamine-6-phosphate deaminase [Clostridiales bacterium]|nr:glucosamine-6-phosphate deaminase [Clostridiales bacterium]